MTGAFDERARVRRMIQDTAVATLLTLGEDGAFAGRPMLPLLLDDDAHIYFLTHASSRKVTQVAARPCVALAVSAPAFHLVVAGRADVSRDAALIRRLWHPSYRAWFPDGKDDRDAAVLRVSVDRVDYWEPPQSSFVRVAQAVRAVLTRRPIDTPMKTLDGL